MKPEGFPRRLRLRRRPEFLRVQRHGEKHHTRHFLVFVAPSGLLKAGETKLPPTRLGVTVTRKVGKAVHRNRIKRLVREAFRRERRRFAAGLDLVWIAKRDATAATFERTQRDMRRLAEQLKGAPR